MYRDKPRFPHGNGLVGLSSGESPTNAHRAGSYRSDSSDYQPPSSYPSRGMPMMHSTNPTTNNTNPSNPTPGLNSNSAHRNPNGALVKQRTCLHSSTRWFQLIMFIMFVVACTLGLTLRYKRLSPGLIWGAILSLFSVFFVIISYASVPNYRQHPNPLVFWRTIADALFVSQMLAQQFIRCVFFDCKPLCNGSNLQCGCANDLPIASDTCVLFAGLFEFSLMASECWFFCMTLNLLLSLTNPFTDFKRNTKLFHAFCWGFAGLLAVLLMSIKDLAGYSDMQVCWTNAFRDFPADDVSDPEKCPNNYNILLNFVDNDDYKPLKGNYVTWVFFYLLMAFFIVFGIAVWLWAWKRLSEGMPETYAVRVQSINRARFNVFAVTIYWLVVGIVYARFLATTKTEDDGFYRFISELLNFLMAAKGYLDLVIWFALNDFRLSDFTSCFKQTSQTDVDVDLNPQVNAALRREVLFYTTSGIVQAVRAAERLPAAQRIQHLALLPQTKHAAPPGAPPGAMAGSAYSVTAQPLDDGSGGSGGAFDESLRVAKHAQRKKTFHDYEPHSFKRIRERFGVDNEAYLQSLSSTAKERLSEGASGAFMFFSGDGSLIVKSTSKEECAFLRSIAQQYAEYLCNNPNSLLTRFYGCHCVELYGKQFSFVVMANLFDTDQIIHSRYDIKGSWVNRHADLPKKGKKVTCRHCNGKYVYQSSAPNDANCPSRLGGHEPNVVLKDSDLTQKLKLHQDVAIDLYRQLCADSDFLCSFGIMDYSLLMGVNEVEYVVDGTLLGETDDVATMVDSVMGNAMGHNGTGNGTADSSFATQMSDGSYSFVKRHQVSVATGIGGAMPKKSSPLRDDRSVSNASSGRRLPRSGMRTANTVVGPAYYHLGIIDILQTWTLQKRMERFFKIAFKGVDGEGLSAIPPEKYKTRFQIKMADILGIEEEFVECAADFDLYTQQNAHMDVETTRTSNVGIQSIRSLATNDHHMAGMDQHVDSNSLRRRPSDRHHQQSVGQDTEEYTGIDYHL